MAALPASSSILLPLGRGLCHTVTHETGHRPRHADRPDRARQSPGDGQALQAPAHSARLPGASRCPCAPGRHGQRADHRRRPRRPLSSCLLFFGSPGSPATSPAPPPVQPAAPPISPAAPPISPTAPGTAPAGGASASGLATAPPAGETMEPPVGVLPPAGLVSIVSG